MVANILPADPPPPPHTHDPGSQKVKIQLYHNMVMLHIKLNGTTKCSNMVTHILPTDPMPLTLGDGSIGQKSTFSEHGHIAYQIKENHECNNMVANIFEHTMTPRDGVKIQLFQNMVMLHIKLMGTRNAATW